MPSLIPQFKHHPEFVTLFDALASLDPLHPLGPEQPGKWFVHKQRIYFEALPGRVASRPV